MPLEEYRRKRDFAATPEPAGESDASAHPGPLRFVIHKHAARALHYDLRLEVGGVYASWAVPKGPSLDTHDKHLAVHVEDHPLEYGEFEGVIPAGEYGGGTVMIWDRGTLTPVNDPAAGIAKGDFKFVLSGSKLQGQWVLVRMKPRPGEKRENWLLIKEKDDYVRPRDAYDVLVEEPNSAATGRTMEQIAAAGETWEAKGSGDAPPLREAARETAEPVVSAFARKPRSGEPDAAPTPDPMPADEPFQLATLVTEAPSGTDWFHEVKYDGYRLRVVVEHRAARVLTRNHADWTDRFPGIAAAALKLPIESVLLDGEAVVMDDGGVSDFGMLQEALATKNPAAVRFKVFDLLYLNGHDLRAETLRRRKDVLATLLADEPKDAALALVDHFEGHGPDFHAASCALLLEGSVSKRADRPWVPGRTHDWLKAKCLARQEFVVGGWTDPAGSRGGFGALLLGVHDQSGALIYAGRVGTGFTQRELAEIHDRMVALGTDTPPFADPPHGDDIHWVRPEVVVEAVFREWTRENVVRQASYKGLREDKPAAEVVRELPGPGHDENGDPLPEPSSPPKLPADPPAPASPPAIRGIVVTNPDRVLEPAGISKLALARYYDAVAEHMLPHVAGRPLTIVRCPHGAAGHVGCFYQKHPETRGWPDTFGTVNVMDSGGPAEYFFVNDAAGLVALAQLGTLEIHTWNSMAKDTEHPDRIIFDLDPGDGLTFPEVAAAAVTVRDALAALGIGSFVKTTGGHGLHVVAPIVPQRGYDEVRDFTHRVVDFLARQAPDRFIGVMSKAKRPGLVFIDYLRNAHGATAVCALSTRARPGTPVSVPISWDELAGIADPAAFDTVSVPKRLALLSADPWAGYEAARVPLTDAIIAAVAAQTQP